MEVVFEKGVIGAENKKVRQALLFIREYCKMHDCEECTLDGTICKSPMEFPINWEHLEEDIE